MLLASAFLLASATIFVQGQIIPINYDPCHSSNVAYATHHSPYPTDCRKFYNCDNANNGKLQDCPEGTLYDKILGICTHNADCPKWYQDAQCQNNPARDEYKFPGQCCDTYFSYSCRSQSFRLVKCPIGMFFVANNGINGGDCTSSTLPSSGCTDCQHGLNPDHALSCNDTHIMPVPGTDQCSFRMNATSSQATIPCPDGTYFNRTICRCLHDNRGICPKQTLKTGCNNKYVYEPANNIFKVLDTNAQTQDSRVDMTNLKETLWKMDGQDPLHPCMIMSIRAIVQQGVSELILLRSDVDECGNNMNKRAKLLVTMDTRSNPYTLVVQYGGDLQQDKIIRTTTLPAPGGEQMITVYIKSCYYESYKNNRGDFEVTVNGRKTNQGTLPTEDAVVFETIKNWQLCRPVVGPFPGTFVDFTYWKECDDIDRVSGNPSG